jgi:Uma2 family endonuclease
MGALDIVSRKPTAAELEQRFREVMDDARFSDIGPWELNEHGDIVVSPVSGEHGRAQALLVVEIERQLGGRAWIEQAIRRDDGPPIVPDVQWSDPEFYEAHKRSGLLPRAPRLCVEIVSPSNSIEHLREKCRIYLALGAEEAWIVDPISRLAEIYGKEGRRTVAGLGFDFMPFWAAL